MEHILGLPLNAAAHGVEIDKMLGLVHWLMLVLFVGWSVFFVYILVRFRRGRNPKADYVGVKGHTSSYLEVGVALFEGFLLLAFAFPIWSSRVTAFPPDDQATVVRVVAEQFAWNIHYPGPDGIFGMTKRELVSPTNPIGLDRTDPDGRDDIVSVNQFNVPIGKPVIVRLSSKDVIHSFFLPHFRVKQDAVPGEVIRTWFTPTMTTAEMKEKLAQTVSIANGAYPHVLSTYVCSQDYADKDGNVIAYKDYGITEDQIPALNAAGINEVKVEPETPMEIACAQLCGLGHYRMRGFMEVMTPEDYQAWIEQQESMIVLPDSSDDSMSTE